MIDRLDVEVCGGRLATFRMGRAPHDEPLVLAIHGITSSSHAWLAVTRALGGAATLIAPDLRGRGASNELAGPYGIAAHARDMVAVLDHLGLDSAVVVGHSLGAYIAARLAADHPARVRAVVLVDGGLTIPGSEGVDPQAFLDAFLGPAVTRLKMSFPARDAYREWWRGHPAIAGGDVQDDDLAAYADHDLVGEEPHLHSAVTEQAVRADAADLFQVAESAQRLTVPATLMCAPRGLQDDPYPMQPLPLVRAWADGDPGLRHAVQVPGVNHYTIVLGRLGAGAVAKVLAEYLPRGES